MRSRLPLLVLTALLLAGQAAHAAPTCQTRQGLVARCGTPAAMPLGWTAPAPHADSGADPRQLVSLVLLLGGLFGLIAMLPDFDGWNAADDGDGKSGDPPGRSQLR